LHGLADLGLLSRLTTAVAEIRDPFGSGAAQVAALHRGTVRATARVSSLVALAAVVVAVAALSRDDRELLDTVVAFIVAFAVAIPLQAPLRLLHGLQRVATANLLTAAGAVAGLIGVLLFYHASGDSLTVFTILTTSGMLVSGALAWLVVRTTTPFHRGQTPIPPIVLGGVLRESWPYVATAAATLVAFSSDHLLLAWLGDDSAVAEYATTYRLFTLVPVTVYLAAYALWPAAADARSDTDREWLRSTTKRVLSASFATTGLWVIGMLAFGNEIVSWWTDGAVRPGALLLVSCGAYALIHAIWSPLHFVLVGDGQIRFQATCMLLMAPVNIAISALLIGPYAAAGPVIGSAIALSTMVVVPYLARSRRVFSKSYKPSAKRAPSKAAGRTST
jgi:O-antigen/teichoic acid export membrane protein